MRSNIGASKELRQILELVGQSVDPLSPRKIEIKLYGKYDRHSNVYRILHDLAGINSKDDSIFLVSWSEVCSKMNEEYFKNRLVKKISQLFNDPKLEDNDSYSFTVYEDESNYGLDVASSKSLPKHRSMNNNIIQISFDTGDIKNISGTLQTDYAILGYPLHIKYDKNNDDYKLYVKQSTIGEQKNKIQFLKHVLKNSTKEEISKLGGKDNVFYVDKPNQDISDVSIIEDVLGEGKDEWNRSNMI